MKQCLKCKNHLDESLFMRSGSQRNTCNECESLRQAVKNHELGLGKTAFSVKVRVARGKANKNQKFISKYGSDVAEVFDSLGWGKKCAQS